MKLTVVLALLCCLALSVLATPVPKSANSANSVQSKVQQSRQAAAPAAPSSDDDDDDDEEDDDDFGLTGDDDDDDDDDEEDDDDDDDDDDDYLERFIDDVLGGDEDDDDDETNAVQPASSVAASAVQPVAASANSPVIPPAVQADLDAELNSAAATVAETDASVAEDATYEDEDTPEGQAAGAVADATIEGAESVANPVVLQQTVSNAVPAAAPASSSSDDDDDDDEDDDDDDDDDDEDVDVTGVLDDDDDDDDDDDEEADDDEEEEDDDDEDDIDGLADVDLARKHRALTSASTDVSAIYVAKYNRFVDTILNRINKILKDKYDPVTVRLSNPTPPTTTKKTQKTTSTKKKSKKTKKTKRRKASRAGKSDIAATRIEEMILESSQNSSDSNDFSTSTEEIKTIVTTTPVADEPTTLSPEMVIRLTTNDVSATTTSRRAPATPATVAKRKKNKTKTTVQQQPIKATPQPSKTKRPTTSTNKVKPPAAAATSSSSNKQRQRSKAKATLYGLSSLKRSGDVSVNMMSDHTTIRTKFNLGPLILKVEKEFGRANRKEVRSATATTAEMSGRLSLRVYHGGAATLHSIRVLQPKQMRIESSDDHDRTREFVWKRSSHIAHLVSQKLSSATRSMLRPPPAAVAA